MERKKQLVILIAVLLAVASGWWLLANGRKENPAASGKSADTVMNKISSAVADPPIKDSMVINDSLLLDLTKQVLTSIKAKDYKKLAGIIHPVEGVRFSAYAFISADDISLSAGQFLSQVQNPDKLNWGTEDGSGETVLLTLHEYFKKFVYNADFLHAEKTSVNKMIGSGNSLNNLKAFYKSCNFTESFFSGFDKKYEGMDWCCLRLVYRPYHGKLYLAGIVHDQWTI